MTQTSNLKKIRGVYHAAVKAGGKTKWVSTGCESKAEAEKILAESGVEQINRSMQASRLTVKAIGQALTGQHLTCAKALEKYCEMKAASRAAKTIANHALAVREWMKAANAETLAPSAVTPQQIGRWLNNPKSTLRAATRKSMLAGVRGFFSFCADQGWILSDPSQLVEVDYSVMSHEQKENDSIQPFTEDEVKLLISELRKDWKRAETEKHELFRNPMDVLFWLVACSIGKETGLRISDIARLEWRSFADAGHMVVWTGKTNRRVELPVSETLHNLISEVPVNDPKYVFPDQRTLTLTPNKRSFLSVSFGRLLQRLGIQNRSFHSFRHYKATQEFAKTDKLTLAKKLAETLTMEQIATLLGHAHAKTTKGYVH